MDSTNQDHGLDLNDPAKAPSHDLHGNLLSPTEHDVSVAPKETPSDLHPGVVSAADTIKADDSATERDISTGPAGEEQQKVADSVKKDEEFIEKSKDIPVEAKSKVDAELSGDGEGLANPHRTNPSVSEAKQKYHEELVGVPPAEDDRPPYGAQDNNVYPTGRDAQGRDVTPVTQHEIEHGGRVKLAGQPVLDAYGCIIGPENAIAHDQPQDISESQKLASGNLSPALLNARKSFSLPSESAVKDNGDLSRIQYESYLEKIAVAAEAFLSQVDKQGVDLKSVDSGDLRQALQAPRG